MICVIGAGPAGMMAAGTGGSSGKDVKIYERNATVGRKLLITGKGRCNLTNACTVQQFIGEIPRNPKFLYSALNRLDSFKLMQFFQSLNVKLKIERGRRVFPSSDKSKDVLEGLLRFLDNNSVQLITSCPIKTVSTENERVKGIVLENDQFVPASSVILATGGKAYPLTGSTGSGYSIAQELGHNIVKPLPALVPLITKEKWVKEVHGLTLKNVSISLFCKEQILMEDFGEMVFTDKGVSGPIVLTIGGKAAEILDKGFVPNLSIDLKPALTSEQLLARLNRDIAKYGKKLLKNSLFDLLPKAIVPIIIRESRLFEDSKSGQLTKEERMRLVKTIKDLNLVVKDTAGFDEAIITAGGIDTTEINASTMESRIIKGLFFAGEIIDTHGYTGGYNLQIAFSTGYMAGLKCH